MKRLLSTLTVAALVSAPALAAPAKPPAPSPAVYFSDIFDGARDLRVPARNAIEFVKQRLPKEHVATSEAQAQYAFARFRVSGQPGAMLGVATKFRAYPASENEYTSDCERCDGSRIPWLVHDLLNKTLFHASSGLFRPAQIERCTATGITTVTVAMQPANGIQPHASMPYTVGAWAQIGPHKYGWMPVGPRLAFAGVQKENNRTTFVFTVDLKAANASTFRTYDCIGKPPRMLAVMPLLPVLTGGTTNGNFQ